MSIADSLQALQELHKVMPEHLRESANGELQDSDTSGKQDETVLASKGRTFLTDVYGQQTGKNIESALYTLSPRLGYYSVPLVYGGIYADTDTLSIRDVSPGELSSCTQLIR